MQRLILGAFLFSLVLIPGTSTYADHHHLKRDPAPVMSCRGAPWLERETREREEQPVKVIRARQLDEGALGADLGGGAG